MNVLIAEDEIDMQKILRLYLEKEGWTVSTCSNGEEALNLLCDNKFDLLITDWMMPKMSGIELLSEIAVLGIAIKTIMLTAKGTSVDEIISLKTGADDYIKKPFTPEVLLLRIKKLFPKNTIVSGGNVELYIDDSIVKVDGIEVKVTNKEWQLLSIFLENKGRTLSRSILIDNVWGADFYGNERTLDTHIKRLRTKIGRDSITTFVGVGYRFNE